MSVKEESCIQRVKKLTPYLLILCVYSFNVLFLYSQNVKEISIAEVLMPLFAMLMFGYAVMGIALLMFKNGFSAALFSAASGFLFMNYGIIEKIVRRTIPVLRPWHVIPIALTAMGIMIFYLHKKAPSVIIGVDTILCIALGALIIFNLLGAVPSELSKLKSTDSENEFDNLTIDKKSDRPNIYYLLCDEYASNKQLEEYMGYVNEPLDKMFRDNKFNASLNSFNDSIYTETVMTNIFMLDYVADGTESATVNLQRRKEAPLHKILQNAGYNERGIGETSWVGITNNAMSTNTGAVTAQGSSFTSLLLNGTLLDNKLSILSHEDESAKLVSDSLDALDNIEIVPNSSTFTFFYICSPHEPFYFNKDGEMNAASKILYDGSDDNSAYLGQLQYITQRMGKACANIIEKDKDAVIILCSDHGYRYEKNTPRKDCERILNGLYFKGEEVSEFEGKSGVNTMRLVLNKLLDLNMPYVELPNE